MPPTVVARISSGATRIALAAAMRSARLSMRHSFIRNPTVPRFIPNTGLRAVVLEHPVKRLEHEAVAAERDQRLAPGRSRQTIALAKHRFCCPARLRCARKGPRCRGSTDRRSWRSSAMGRVGAQTCSSGRLDCREDRAFKRPSVTVPFRVAAKALGSARRERALPANVHAEVGQRQCSGEAGVGPGQRRRPSLSRATGSWNRSSPTSRSTSSSSP